MYYVFSWDTRKRVRVYAGTSEQEARAAFESCTHAKLVGGGKDIAKKGNTAFRWSEFTYTEPAQGPRKPQ